MKKLVIVWIVFSFSVLVVSGQAENFHEDMESLQLEEVEAELKKQVKTSNAI